MGAAMNNSNESVQFSSQPMFSQHGRKGIAYDWQSLFAASEVAGLDRELAALAPALAE